MQRMTRFIGKKFVFLLVLAIMLSPLEIAFKMGGEVYGAEDSISGTLTDIKGHWAENSLSDWSSKGYVQGYADGTFKPDNTVTRGEFMAFVNRSFGFSKKVSIDFRDVNASNWVYNEVAKAVAAGYIKGYEDGTIGVDRPISRQEAAIIIARLIQLDGTVYRSAVNRFGDASLIAEWSSGAVGAVANAGLMEGYKDGNFNPKSPITRAEAVVTLDRAIAVRFKATYEQAGVYGPSVGIETVSRDVVVNAAGITLRNMRITGNLILAEGIGEGQVFLENVAIEGTTTVTSSGAELSVDEGSTIASLLLEAAAKITGKGRIKQAIISEQARASTFEKQPDQVKGPGSISPSPTSNVIGGGNSSVTPGLPTPTPTPSTTPPSIVSEGQGHAVIIKPAMSGPEINEAAAVMAEYIERATGAKLPIYTIDQLEELDLDPSTVTIRIGTGSYEEDLNLAGEVAALHSDGFIIAPDGQQLIITSPTLVGTRNGVYAFLEKYVGVTWLFPGEEWIDIPQMEELRMPSEAWKDEPTAFSLRRTVNMGSGNTYGTVRSEWYRQNRTISASEIALGHNIFTLFPVDKYGDTEKYPDFYPKNKPPAQGDPHRWQPCYSNPATIPVAIDEIKEYFRKNPNAISFSLAVNDGGGYCEDNPTHPQFPNKINSVGVQHMSEIYYKWVNEVVEGVLEDYPNKWFGLYAYQQVMDPPDFPLNSRVIPVVTKDRLAWADPEVEAQGKAHSEAWSAQATQLGWYDYMLSGYYPLPRVYPNMVEELYEYAKEQNVLVHHWDMHPVLGDGPQPWIIAKLGWSMEQDVNTLLDHWYESAVGTDAAADLREYFEIWENFWRTEALESDWFKTSKNSTYLSMRHNSYLAFAEDEILRSRPLLEAVIEKTQTPEQKIRAKQLLHQFEFYEASALTYPRQLEKPETDEDVLTMLDELEQTLENRLEMVKRRPELIQEYNQNPTQRYAIDPIILGEAWSGWNPDEFWHIKQYMEANAHLVEESAIKQRILSFQQNTAKPKLREYAHLFEHSILEQSLAAEYSFEEEGIPTWNLWDPNSAAIINVTNEQASDGTRSLRFQNARLAGVWKYVDVKPGLFASSVKFFTPEGTTSQGTVQIVIELHAGSNKLVYYSDAMTLADHAGEWTELTIFDELPTQIKGVDIERLHINTQVRDAEDATVYLDDIGIYQVQYGVADMIDIVNLCINEEKLTNEQAGPLLDLLESAEEKFQQEEIEQYVSLLVEFITELEQLRSGGVLNEDNSQYLIDEAYTLIRQQIDFQLVSKEFTATHAGTYQIPVTIKNNHFENLAFELFGHTTDGIQLNFGNPVHVSAKQSLKVDGTLSIPEELVEGDYFVNIHLRLGGKDVLISKIEIVYNTNLLRNPSFEDGEQSNPLNANYWSLRTMERSSDRVYDGEYAIKANPGETAIEARSNDIAITPGLKYRLSGWVYSDNSKARFGLRQTNQSGASLKYDYTPMPTSKQEWQYFELEIDPRADATILQVYLRLEPNVEAPAWFDNLKLEIIASPQQLDLQLSSEEIKTTHSGAYEFPVTIRNNHSEDLTLELSGTATNGIQLDFDNPVTVPANQSLTVEGTLTVPEVLEGGDYFVEISLRVGGEETLHKRLKVTHDTNLLKNPGFEEASLENPLHPNYWLPRGMERSNEKPHTGNYAMKATPIPESAIEARSDDIAIIPGAKYLLSGWVYSENGKARFGLRQTNQTGASLKYDYSPMPTPKQEWQYFELEISPRADATILQVYLRLEPSTGGPAWFDDIQLEIIPAN